MLETLLEFFRMAQFIPHGMCLLWRPDLLLMHGVSDFLITAAYFTIPLVILRAVRARPDLINPKVARMFAAFIAACGLSHAAGLVTLWTPLYALQGLIKIATAAVSIYTTIQLIRLLPLFLTMPSRADLANSEAQTLAHSLSAKVAQRANEELRKVQAELVRSNRDLDEFAYIASHDLKEPIRGVSINADFLQRETLPDPVRSRIDRISELCARMEGLISDLLTYSRLGRSEGTAQNIDMAAIIRDIESDLQESLAPVEGRVEIETPLPAVRADRSKIDIVFRNLITNAVKYNTKVPRVIRIGFRPEMDVGGETMQDVFYVEDEGIGIDARNHDKAFRIFSRLNAKGAFGAGSGVGLTFVKRIVEDLGGTIRLASAPGQGTTFGFTLPLSARAETKPGPET